MPAVSAPEGAPVSPDPPGYPRELERDVVSGGFEYRVRPIRPDDGRRLVELHGRLSPRSVYLRFFGGASDPQRGGGRAIHAGSTTRGVSPWWRRSAAN